MLCMAGGAKDINTFRKQVDANALPDVSTITYEGIFNEYYFDTLTNIKNDDEKQYSTAEQLMIPTYCFARTKVPAPLRKAQKLAAAAADTTATQTGPGTNDEESEDQFEYFMNVGLNENFDVNAMKRNNLNLMIVLDHSGSMGSPFDYKSKESKMKVANEAVIALFSQLTDEDRLGVLKFDNQFTIVQPMALVKNINMEELSSTVRQIKENGGTNMEMAYKAATQCYTQLFESIAPDTPSKTKQADTEEGKDNDKQDAQNYSNRVIFLTDAMPNSYASNSDDSLLKMMQRNAATHQFKGHQIHTTFIGVGLDFNTKFVEEVIKVEGGNYYAVHSNEEFMKTMRDEFKFMVTPLVFDFVLTLMAEGNSTCIAEVFGSGDDEKAIKENGEVMNAKSMFASQHDENDQVKGGVVVLKLKNAVNGKANVSYDMVVEATYKDIDNKPYSLSNNVTFGGGEENAQLKTDEAYFDNLGIRKSLLLIRYIQFLKTWMVYQQKQENQNKVPEPFKNIVVEFKEYFQSEMELLKDSQLENELKILNQLMAK
mmetsp:Transcript_11041/g.16705  ORF Transcript_11041/g.16705 Transcript_11041/m.16705 type:complete len:541 (-) Transcript_11041:63-1685(-)